MAKTPSDLVERPKPNIVSWDIDLPEPVARRGIDESQWRTLTGSLFPGAKPDSILMVIDYCRARKLDPLKKPCHIVPMRVKDQQTGEYRWRDVVMPGIYEYRTTAQRTGEYLGHSAPEYGPLIEHAGVTAPEWCAMTMRRGLGEFPVRVYFAECVATKEGKANERWTKAPIQMLTKCTEAAGLREAFPDEFGGEVTAEELEGRTIDVEAERPEPPKPAQRASAQKPATAVEPEPPRPDVVEMKIPPQNIGAVVNLHDRGDAKLLELDTGFHCSTRNPTLMQAALDYTLSKKRVELVCRDSSDPSKFAPILVEILPYPSEISPS